MFSSDILKTNFSELSDEEILTKIGELQKRLSIAHKMNSGAAIQQINFMLQQYEQVRQERFYQKYNEETSDEPTSIDIDWPDEENENNLEPDSKEQ